MTEPVRRSSPGKASSLEVLLAEQNAMGVEFELIETWRRQRVVTVSLYKALDGGWQRQPK